MWTELCHLHSHPCNRGSHCDVSSPHIKLDSVHVDCLDTGDEMRTRCRQTKFDGRFLGIYGNGHSCISRITHYHSFIRCICPECLCDLRQDTQYILRGDVALWTSLRTTAPCHVYTVIATSSASGPVGAGGGFQRIPPICLYFHCASVCLCIHLLKVLSSCPFIRDVGRQEETARVQHVSLFWPIRRSP